MQLCYAYSIFSFSQSTEITSVDDKVEKEIVVGGTRRAINKGIQGLDIASLTDIMFK